jgi:hypothetical protein
LFLAAVTVPIYFVGAKSGFLGGRAGTLVDQSKYQLTSLEGQRDFAKKVIEVGKLEVEPAVVWIFSAFGVFLLLALASWALMLALKLRHRFPLSIAKNIAEDGPSGASQVDLIAEQQPSDQVAAQSTQ